MTGQNLNHGLQLKSEPSHRLYSQVVVVKVQTTAVKYWRVQRLLCTLTKPRSSFRRMPGQQKF